MDHKIATRYDMMKLFDDQHLITGVEVGTDQGVLASDWLRNEPRLHLHTIDPWLSFAENPTDRTHARRQYQLNMQPFVGKSRFRHWEMTSVKAASELAKTGDEFDFVYLDAAHDVVNVQQDLESWWPLVRDGGCLAGHDFDTYDVAKPVIAFVKRHRLNLEIINEHGSAEDHAKDNGAIRPGSGMDKYGGWAHLSWYFRKGQ